MSDDIEDLHRTVLRTQAMCFALETLCLALFSCADDKEAAIKRFVEYEEHFSAKMLFDNHLADDAPLQEFQAAHARILSLIRNVRS